MFSTLPKTNFNFSHHCWRGLMSSPYSSKTWLNSLPNNNFFRLIQIERLADDIINVTEKLKFCFGTDRKQCGEKKKMLFSKDFFFKIVESHDCVLTHYHTMPHLTCLRYIAVENKQSPFFSLCFLPYMALISHFKCTLKCCLQFVSVWTSLKFCRLVMG